MNQVSVLQWLGPFLAKELKDVDPLDVMASLQALQRYEKLTRDSHHMPGVSAFPNSRLNHGIVTGAYHFCRLAMAIYGWKGLLFFKLTDPNATYGLDDLRSLASVPLSSDADAFANLSGLPKETLLYSSPKSAVGIPKHIVAVDDSSHSIVCIIRGTMTLNDVLTDVCTKPVRYAGGWAHEGIAHAATAIYTELHDLLETELAKRPGYGLVLTGHSLGAAAAILLTIHIHYLKAKAGSASGVRAGAAPPFAGIDIHCYAYAPPPVYGPLSSLPPACTSSITALVHGDDLISRLSVEGIRELLSVLRAVSKAHPSWFGRMFSDVELQKVLAQFPGYAPSTPPDVSGASVSECGDGYLVVQSPMPKRLEEAVEEEELKRRMTSVDGRDILPHMPPESSVCSTGDSEDTPARFMIPGNIYLFRAPVEIGAAEGMKDRARDSIFDEAAPAVGRQGVHSDDAARGWHEVGPASSPLASAWAGALSMGSSITGAAKSAASAASSAAAAVTTTAAAVTSSATNLFLRPTHDDEVARARRVGSMGVDLAPGVGAEAVRLSLTDTVPFVTLVQPNELGRLPLTDRAWRDHVPDQYLFGLRQLKEVADRQLQEALEGGGRGTLSRQSKGTVSAPLSNGNCTSVSDEKEKEQEGSSLPRDTGKGTSF